MPADIRRRENRLLHAIEYVSKTFDHAKLGTGLNLESTLILVRRIVEDVHHKGINYDKQITSEDLAIALAVIERVSFQRAKERDHQWGCPNNRIIGGFRSFKFAGVSKRGCSRHKAIALKRVLMNAGLAEVIDDSYRPGNIRRKKVVDMSNNTIVLWNHESGYDPSEAWGAVGTTGRGKRVVIGYKHPRYAEWETREYAVLWEWVLKGTPLKATDQLKNETVVA